MSSATLTRPQTGESPVSTASRDKTPSVESILKGLRKRGLSVTLNDSGDGLRLHGPKEARTEIVRETLKSVKPALVAYLRSTQNQSVPVSSGDDVLDGPILALCQSKEEALILHQCGVPAVAVGVTAIDAEKRDEWLLKACEGKTVILAFAEENASQRWEDALRDIPVHEIKTLRPEGGKDWGQLLQTKGIAWLRGFVLPRVYWYPVTIHHDPDPALELAGERYDSYYSRWPDSITIANERLMVDAFDCALPVEPVVLPSPIKGEYRRCDDANILAICAYAVMVGGIQRQGDKWLETPAGLEVSAILRRLAVWWMGHPEQINRE